MQHLPDTCTSECEWVPQFYSRELIQPGRRKENWQRFIYESSEKITIVRWFPPPLQYLFNKKN